MVSESDRRSYDYISDIIEDEVLSLASRRSYEILEFNDGYLNERDTIPFITSRFYLIFLIGYLLIKRLESLYSRYLKRNLPKLEGHIFILTSVAAYRFYPLLLVADRMPEQTTILCSEEVEKRVQQERPDGDFNLVTHRSLHQCVPVFDVLKYSSMAWELNQRIANRLQVDASSSRWTGFNLLLTEYVKAESVSNCDGGIVSLHTQSDSPYVFKAVEGSRLFIHQHGQKLAFVTRIAATGREVTYFTWGSGWDPEFYAKQADLSMENILSSIDFIPAGNPFFDQLIDRRENYKGKPSHDILFISQSHVLAKHDPKTYHDTIAQVIRYCDQNGLDFTVKLHTPQEDSSFYREYGWEEFIVSGNIEETVLDSKITLMDSSSAFLESVILGRPSVVTEFVHDVYDQELLDNVPGILRPSDMSELETKLDQALHRNEVTVRELNESGSIRLLGSTERIISHTLDKVGSLS